MDGDDGPARRGGNSARSDPRRGFGTEANTRMDPTAQSIWFAGDLGDPWVVDLVESLRPLDPVRCDSRGEEIPDRPFEAADPARVLVLHRSRVSRADVARLEEWRKRLGPERWPRVVLCVSPYVRYAELESCASLVDLILPEATARETLPRELRRLMGHSAAARPAAVASAVDVEIVSTDYEVRSMLREACLRAGYEASDAPTFQSSANLAVWDVPVLESRWAEQLERRSSRGPVVALLGFADRAAVSAARDAGASACLDFPCAIDDLIHVLDRLAVEAASPTRGDSGTRAQSPHPIPAPHAARPQRGRTSPASGAVWPKPAAAPRMPPGPAN
jgi:hypothetical protein